MKQKYTLVISDVELNVVTDASKEAVEKIVGILDRKMRDINLKSYRCTKNQAALLCALEYCSEKLELQDRNAELEEIAEQDAATIAEQENQLAELQAEMKKLQDENEIMHNILERAAASTKRMMGNHEPAAEAVEVSETAETPETPEVPEAPEAAEEPETPEVPEALEEPEAPEQLTVDFDEAEQPVVNTKAAQVLEEIAESQTDAPRAKAKAKKAKSRSRVGSMFDLLTFNDV
ncbi:MAG: cell division protein ZapA [Clostridia bacterium]|nr:cell division protein ZapA [Clostridia bacterium]